MLKRDENRVTVGGGVTDDSNKTVEPLRTDPVTGRLLIEIYGVTSTTPSTLKTVAYKDGNYANTGIAVTDDANSTVTPLIIDSRNNYLFVDLLIE